MGFYSVLKLKINRTDSTQFSFALKVLFREHTVNILLYEFLYDSYTQIKGKQYSYNEIHLSL